MALFNSKPYLIVNTDLVPHLYRNIVQGDNFVRFCFADALQRLTVGAETTDLLLTEFARMWEAVDGSNWRPPVHVEENLGSRFLTWLR